MTIDDVFVIENAQNKKRAENILNSLFVLPRTDRLPLLVTHCVPFFGGGTGLLLSCMLDTLC